MNNYKKYLNFLLITNIYTKKYFFISLQKMEERRAKLVLTIKKKIIYFESCEVFNSIYSLKTAEKITIDIPEYVFAKSKERKIIQFKLKRDTEPSLTLLFKFNVYYGINKAYCFLDPMPFTSELYEICFYKKVVIKYEKEILIETDSFEDDSRTRIILINSPRSLFFNNTTYALGKLKINNFLEENSFEVALFNTSKRYFATKLIKEKEQFSVIQMVEKNKNELEKLYNEIKKLYIQKENDKNKYLSTIKNYNISKVEINFSQRKSVLKNEFKNEEDYKLMYQYIVWYAIGAYYKENTTIFISILDLFDCFEKSYKEFLEDKDLLIYERIMLVCSKIIYIMTFTDINEYKKSNLTYIKNKNNNILPKSVFGICFNFMNEFIKNLTPQSYLFYPLLLLDSGIYTTSEEKSIYGFNMETCEIVKSHLNELIPDIFFLYEKKVDLLNEEGGFNFKGYGVVFINKLLSLNKYDKDPALYEYKSIEEEKINKHYGMRVGKTMIHESFCHNKFIFEFKTGNESPTNFYNAEMNLIKIVPKNSRNYTDDYFRVAKKEKKGEGGKFFDYFFGLHFGRLVIDLIYEANYIGKLIDNVQYFLKEDLSIIKKYITYKYLIAEKKIKYDEWKNEQSLENEIITMEKLINDFQLNTLNKISGDKKDIKQDTNKKLDNLYGIEFIEEEDDSEEYKGYDYYRKKASEAKNIDEFFEYSHELIKHLKVV